LNGVLFPAGASVALQIALRTAVIYLVVLIGVRLSGKREVGQMTPFDLTLLLLLSNSVQNAMTGPDTSLIGGVVAASTLLLLNYVVGSFSGRNRVFRHVVQGEPSLLISRWQGHRITHGERARQHGRTGAGFARARDLTRP
jgi:uncharacterized membrane protein YcaP (DUF421 family)